MEKDISIINKRMFPYMCSKLLSSVLYPDELKDCSDMLGNDYPVESSDSMDGEGEDVKVLCKPLSKFESDQVVTLSSVWPRSCDQQTPDTEEPVMKREMMIQVQQDSKEHMYGNIHLFIMETSFSISSLSSHPACLFLLLSQVPCCVLFQH